MQAIEFGEDFEKQSILHTPRRSRTISFVSQQM
jgi:hypothetical protein